MAYQCLHKRQKAEPCIDAPSVNVKRRTVTCLKSVLLPKTTKDYHVLVLTILAALAGSCSGQSYRPFPPLFNLAKEKAVSTEPSQSSCGVPTRNAYCRSSTFSDSIFECRQGFCVQECPGRTALPRAFSLLSASGYGACVTADTLHLRPGSPANAYAAVFSSGSLCYLTPLDTPSLGGNGAFTLTFWMWQEAGNAGVVLEKYTTTGQVILRVRVDGESVSFLYRSVLGLREVIFLDSFPGQTWNFIALQVYDAGISYFINGTAVGYSARGYSGLVGAVRDEGGNVRIGQSNNGVGQYVGRLQDVTFYGDTLTNREIDQIYSGSLPATPIQSQCRCPASHPRVKPFQTSYCIPNGVPDNIGDDVLRLNNDSHPLQYLSDGDSNSFWVSSFLNEITITVTLGDQFQVFYVVLQFYSPQPKVVSIERRKDAQSSWQPWQLYAEECALAFGIPNNGPLTTPTSVNCIQFGTNGLPVPYSKGNITFNMLSPEPQPRPGHNDFYNTPELAEFVKASEVRVRMQGHYYVTHPRHEYYGIYEYIVTGRCSCSGHAETCDTSVSPYQCQCLPSSYTEGNKCERCRPLYNNKPFRAGTQIMPHSCKACDCHDHAESCVYDVSLDPFPSEHDRGEGGICVNCQHNTSGRWCDTCQTFYFRQTGVSLYSPQVCQACACFAPGVRDNQLDCQKIGGLCSCKEWVGGRQCDTCLPGYYNLQPINPMGCEPCNCNLFGTVEASSSCHATMGLCTCKANVRNSKCDACQYGFFNLTDENPAGCEACDCNPAGSTDQFCNPTDGQCSCRPNVIGRRCDQCRGGFLDFETGCQPCDCDSLGTIAGSTCDTASGQCQCKPYVTGARCDQCQDGYFSLGSDPGLGCSNCGCDPLGTNDMSALCDKVTGSCQCKDNVQGRTCNQCLPNTFNLTGSNGQGCQRCDCDASGTLNGDQLSPFELTCDQNTGQCTCRTNRVGRRCDVCEPGFFLNASPGGGCEPCACPTSAVVAGSTCDMGTGQCLCRYEGVGGRRCDQCLPGSYQAGGVEGCAPCNCDLAGSLNNTCATDSTGQCVCKEFTTGRECGRCIPGTSDLSAENPFGCSKTPSQQPPPGYTPINSTTLRLHWLAPDYPNGVILRYYLYRDNGLVATLANNATLVNDTEMANPEVVYLDTGLTPFTDYRYQVVAENAFGTTASPVVTYRTPSGSPSGEIVLRVADVTSQSAVFTWNQPTSSNGVIERYELSSTTVVAPTSVTLHYRGLSLRSDVTSLLSYMNYTFHVTVCTTGGCLSSAGVEVITKESLPQGQNPPTVQALSQSDLFVTWSPPDFPNGIIIFYELWMRGAMAADGTRDPEEIRIFHPAGQYNPLPSDRPEDLSPPATNFSVSGLTAFREYEFKIFCENSIGKASSVWVAARTGEAPPQYMPTPDVIGQSSTTVSVVWEAPAEGESQGTIVTYRIFNYHQMDLASNPFAPPFVWTLLYEAPVTDREYLASGLQPYTNQTFVIEACNNVGCVNSSEASGMTLPSVPAGLDVPTADGYNYSAVQITWSPPERLNGPPPTYVVRATQASLNKPPLAVSKGTRFPGLGYHLFPPDTVPQGVGFTGIELSFKTSSNNGLILFAASEGSQEEFMAIQIRSGRPWFLYDPQGCTAGVTIDDENVVFSEQHWHHLVVRRQGNQASVTVDGQYTGCASIVTTTDDEGLPYDDGTWHHLRARRDGKSGNILLDSKWTGGNVQSSGERESTCATGNVIGRNTGVYIGGIPDGYIIRKEDDGRAQVMDQRFEGCIKDVRILTQMSPEEIWTPLNWSTVIRSSEAMPEWEGCPVDLETRDTLHFLGQGHAEVPQALLRFNPGVLRIIFEFRTDLQNGLMFYMHGAPGNYLLVQLVGGGLYVAYGGELGRGSALWPNSAGSLCDGLWHHVMVFRRQGEITIQVGGTTGPTVVTGSQEDLHPVLLSSNLLVGGIPPDSEAAQSVVDNRLEGLIQKDGFGGCLKQSVNFNTDNINVNSPSTELRGVYTDGCPPLVEPEETCQASLTRVVYTGPDLSAIDHGLVPFTEYVYQVEARNEAGSTFSPWTAARTREGPPTGVSGPYDVQVIDGFTIFARWPRPGGQTGQLSEFRLRAYNMDDPMADLVEAVFNDTAGLSGQITDAVPFTNYTVKFVACTLGGCTESVEGVAVTTVEEAPQRIDPPRPIEVGASYIHMGWNPPGAPNGVLTGYFLFLEREEVYSGALTSFNVTGLDVYIGYRFFLRTCTRVACADSEEATYSTSQLPPSHVAPPRLTVLGTSRIRADWSHPDQLNGVLERYQVSVAAAPGDPGELVYNSTDLFLYYVVEELRAGTAYYISVGACTGGGCRHSDFNVATTEESAPEGIPDPVILSPSPSELSVTWGYPESPNGFITGYKLFQNGLLIYTDPSERNYLVTNLQAWSLHLFRVEACTVMGCGSSNEVQARTQEAPPEGSIGLVVLVTGPRKAQVTWNPITTPNGIVFYDVYFEGLFYFDPDNWDYRPITERRSLLRTVQADEPVQVEGLIPFSVYNVQVNASNTVGAVLSNVVRALMPRGSPDGVRAPTLTSPSATTVRAEWQQVGRANADEDPVFQLQFKETTPDAVIQDLFEQPTTSNSYLRTGLRSFTEYEFRIVASNSFGATMSEWAAITTKQDSPLGVDPPMTTSIEARSMVVAWDMPLESNGIIVNFGVYVNGEWRLTVPGNTTEAHVTGLVPSTVYTFQVEVCTVAGCTISEPSRPATTLEAGPEGIAAPILVSQTPTSVLVVWTEPTMPNGVILQYGIERRLPGSTDIILVRTFLPAEPKQYVDQSRDIVPNMEYEYRVTAENNAGSARGPWASVTTKSSRPGGVQAPTVTVLGPTSMLVEWEPPIQTNGPMESYVVALPEPRFEIRNISQTAIVVEGLRPFTQYRITVTACSAGGCTESLPTSASTSPSVPGGVGTPVGTPISETYVSVLWQPPEQPNGPNVRYELSRMKVRQPLDPLAQEFGTWFSIYLGANEYFEDRGLTLFTTYQYRVTVYNDFGHTTSDPSTEVTTFGGTPSRAALVSVTAVNHTAIFVTWQTPTVQELQGAPSKFIVNATSSAGSTILTLGPNEEVAMVTDLSPNMRYEVRVTIEVHGGATITSEPAVVTTSDGAPEGVSTPIISVINETALRVSWTAPENPNGDVTGYFVYLDDQRLDSGMATPGSMVLANLQPYTIYRVQVEVCTDYACVRSQTVTSTTAESVPEGVVPPALAVQGPEGIEITWSPPSQPNGIILRHELLRKTKVPCSEIDQPTPPPTSGKCTFFECGILESFCGAQCYSGPKTCCEGVVHDNKQGYECCGSSYVPTRQNPDDVCCGGQFRTLLDNHQCCGDRYVEVGPDQICCPDPAQTRVDIGYGDQCCASVPYATNGSQICCNGRLHEHFGQQCCGDSVVDEGLVCCGDNRAAEAYQPDNNKFCCGRYYAPTATSVCCADELGNAKAHTYPSTEDRDRANERCCGVERISVGLSCCHNNGYNPLTQTCADISNMDSGCGSGVVCPEAGSSMAFCNRCNFNRGTHKCGSYPPGTVTQPPVYQETPDDPVTAQEGEMCLTDAVKIYTGSGYSYTDRDLAPYTEYQYAVSMVNGAGSTTSVFISARTAETLPVGVTPPVAEVLPSQLDTIYLSWEPPARPNGDVEWYILFRDGVEIFRDRRQREFIDNNAIQPYQTYTYKLHVCNGAGCVESDEVKVATLQGRPEDVPPPVVHPESPSSLRLTWTPPTSPNGYIVQYHVFEAQRGLLVSLAGTWREFRLTELAPYTEYRFVLSACTDAGCTNSSQVSATTLQARPEGVPAPLVVILDSNTAEIYWLEPTQPNGIITGYRLFKSVSGQPFTVVHVSDGAGDTNYTDRALFPMVQYNYIVEAATAAGGTNSSLVSMETPVSPPLGIPAPSNVTVLTSRSLYVEWEAPSQPNGVIDQYQVLLNAGTPGAIAKGVGVLTSDVITDLAPYTVYEVRIRACLQGVPNGCGVGPGVSVQTLADLPENLAPPRLVATGPATVEVTWDPPERPNGVIVQYRLHRRPMGSTAEVLIAVEDGNTYRFVNSDAGLRPYTEYQYKVTSLNSIGETVSEWSVVRTLAAAPQVLLPPVISNVSPYSMWLRWEPPLQPNGRILTYQVDFRPQGNLDPTARVPVESVVVPGTTTETSVSGLQPYTRYDVRVVAANTAGQVASSWVSQTTHQAAPADVGPFRVEPMSDGSSVILMWDVPGRPHGVINNYLVYEEGNVNAIYQGLNKEFEYRRLQPYTRYAIQLEACTLGGCGRSPVQVFYTAEVAPRNLPAPTLGEVTPTSVTLRWVGPLNPSGRITSYEIYRRTQQARRKRALSDPELIYRTTDTDPEEYEYVDETVAPYSEYEYLVRASNAKGSTDSPWSSVETPQAAPTGVAPPTVSQVPNQYDTLQIRWTAPDRANGQIQSYKLRRNDSVPLSFAPDETKEYLDQGLRPHTLYSYRVEVCTGGGCTTSEATLMRTPESAPFNVLPPVLDTVNETTIQVTWQAPQITNGQIREYQLRMDDVIIYRGLSRIFTVGNLQPFQAYTFVVSACTTGGCTDSPSVVGRPAESRPFGMRAPALRVTSSTSIEISWADPDNPNGIITSYELRRDGVLIDTDTDFRMLYIDYEVEPGMTYTYTVTAFNSQGSATSPPATATTYASSPAGLAPPALEPLSSSSIRATWTAPLKPNGEIQNYTLYKSGESVYSDRQLSTTVTGLDPWAEYSFRVQACTLSGCVTSDAATGRTLEAAPSGLDDPRLTAMADSQGAHNGMLVEWSPPRQPNGVIIGYDIHRRNYTGLTTDVAGVTRVLVYTGTEFRYHDNDPALLPFTVYEYQVTARNSQGEVRSAWKGETTSEAPPQRMPPPILQSKTATTFSLRIFQPERPNGVISAYNVYVNGQLMVHSTSIAVEMGQESPLEPFTLYTVYVEACTAGGCTRSPSIEVRTESQRPQGMLAPLIANITDTGFDVAWFQPVFPNGVIAEYELLYRQTCPQPYDTADFTFPCQPTAWVSHVRGLMLQSRVTGLSPYSRYQVRVLVRNDAGSGEASNETEAVTGPAAPQYSQTPPRLQATGNVVLVDWGRSFHVNGEVQEFLLYKNGTIEYSGLGVTFDVIRETPGAVYVFLVILRTQEGTAQTPKLYFDPSRPDYVPPPTGPPETTESAEAVAAMPFYQEVWFIVLLAIIALLLLFIGIAVCIRTNSTKIPYIRERMPLQPRQKKSPLPLSQVMDPYDASILATEIPHADGSIPHVGYINPAYSHLSVPSRSASLLDLNLDKISLKSARWEDDGSLWDMRPDSGLHSLAYGDDYDADSDRPISVLKEHTMFSDTHV